MRAPKLIGLTGYAGSGKDTVREILEVCGYNGFAFADPIRAMLATLLAENGIDDDKYMNTREFKETVIPELGVSYRHMAQTLGTEWGRALHGDFWLRIAASYMESLDDGMEPAPYFVISDVRFANEAAWVREQGGVIWRIERPQAVPVRAHASEAELYHFSADATIDNSGTIDALEHTVMQLLHGAEAAA
jgi:hypothetical protein